MASLLADLSRLPGSPQLHRWADWAELLCLTSPDGSFSRSSLAAAAQQRKDYRDVEDLDEVESDYAGEDDVLASDGPELDDAYLAKASSVFEYLQQRAATFEDAYPFNVAADGWHISLAKDTDIKNVYLFVLVCASLRYVPSKADRTSLTSMYEGLCTRAVQHQMPPYAAVHLFGKNAELTTGRYTGRLVEKIGLLASDLGEKTRFDGDEFSEKDFGDNGLDVVAWFPSGDPLNGKIVIFGQCACTPEWVAKQHSSGDDAWYEVMSLMARPVNVCFIPYDFRRPDGRWYKRSSIQRTVVVDRRRLLHQLGLLPVSAEAAALAADLRDALRLGIMADLRGEGLHAV
jgi:hypothetical protein